MIDRRAFVGMAAAGVTGLAGVGRRGPRGGVVVAQEPWGRLERVGDRVWALISDPLADRTTLCNGGIVAGDAGTLVVESFASPDGAAWMGAMARQLTGRPPTHVVVTHFHGDHANGLAGFARNGSRPELLLTSTTRALIRNADEGSPRAGDPVRADMLAAAVLLDPEAETSLPLGGRSVRLTPRGGHTPSDVSVLVEGEELVYCGDLVWNAMFPNYRDAIPSRLGAAVRAMRRGPGARYVTGHGEMSDRAEYDRFLRVIDEVETAARLAVERGVPAAEAAARFRLPSTLGEWMLFSPRYFEVAFTAWERELRG